MAAIKNKAMSLWAILKFKVMLADVQPLKKTVFEDCFRGVKNKDKKILSELDASALNLKSWSSRVI